MINRRMIWITASSLWGILLTVGPMLLEKIKPELGPLSGGGGGGGSLCP